MSSEDYKLWLNGLQIILNLGSVNVTKVRELILQLLITDFQFQLMSMVQNASGAEPKPIS